MLVFLSDVWLDEAEVLVRLRRLFAGFEEIPPTAFVFFGNFLNKRQCCGSNAYEIVLFFSVSLLKLHITVLKNN